jgi:hypothetical protein
MCKLKSLQWLISWLPPIQGQLAICACRHIIILGCRCIFPSSVYHLAFLLALERGELTMSHTCFVLHFHPFLLSCGHLFAKVAFRASIIFVLEGYSILKTPSSVPMVATIAHPHSSDNLKCSTSGSSPLTHPSIDLWHKKQAQLSG